MKTTFRLRPGRAVLLLSLGLLLFPACRSTPAAFRIVPVRPVAELIHEAKAVQPPPQPAGLRTPDLVDLKAMIPTVRLDIRYATSGNFLGTPVYAAARALLQRPAAEALARVAKALAAEGFGLIVHDAYRPWSVTWVVWQATPEHQHDFVANPAMGSVHNRGAAVDVSLYRLLTGRVVKMPSGYDEFTARAAARYPGGSAKARRLRDRLRRAMEAEGFAAIESEWWHFDFRDSALYPVLNQPLE